MKPLFLAFHHKVSGRHAVLDDDGVSAWLYLHAPSDDPRRTAEIETSVLVHNRGALIDAGDVHLYRPGPPPIAEGYGHELSICAEPGSYQWTVDWLDERGSVVLRRNGEAWSAILQGDGHGYSKAIKRDGPWGQAWDEEVLGIGSSGDR